MATCALGSALYRPATQFRASPAPPSRRSTVQVHARGTWYPGMEDVDAEDVRSEIHLLVGTMTDTPPTSRRQAPQAPGREPAR